jgi:5'-nucleotidase
MKNRPHILITNDDGVHAPGIRHLWEALSSLADLTVVAPLSEQSATSLSITLRNPLKLEKIDWQNGADVWAVNGTPSDCVKLGMNVVFEKEPDLIVSGINRGNNAGRNVLYSGTVAGAIEGVLHGVPAIAFSCHDYWDTDYSMTDRHVPKIVRHIIEHPLPYGTLLNVNFPSKELKAIKGYKLTRQGMEYWKEDPTERHHPAERHAYYWLGAKLAEFEEQDDSDVVWLKKGYITAVPIHINELTDHNHLKSHRSRFEALLSE